MATKTSDYWQNRTLQLEDALHNKGVKYYHDLERQYQKAANDTTKEINKLYTRLATENNITLSGAKKLLTGNELEEFRWSVQDYIKYGKKNVVDPAWTKQLENASLRYRISRLEAMKIHMQNQVEMLMGKEADDFSNVMADIYTEGYYRNAHLIQTGMGVGHSMAKLDNNRISKVLSKPWTADGKNFSERIWGNHRPALVNDLHTTLTQSIIRGQAPDKAINAIAHKFKVAKSKAGNLVMTESAYFGTVAQQDCYKELDVEMQEFVATLDNHTSEICQSMDGKVFKSNEIQIGVNAPPLHCRCRSVMVPYFEDNITERAARDEEGKTVYIDGNMKYGDWFKKFVKGEELPSVNIPLVEVSGKKPDIYGTDDNGESQGYRNIIDEDRVNRNITSLKERKQALLDEYDKALAEYEAKGGNPEEQIKALNDKISKLNAEKENLLFSDERLITENNKRKELIAKGVSKEEKKELDKQFKNFRRDIENEYLDKHGYNELVAERDELLRNKKSAAKKPTLDNALIKELDDKIDEFEQVIRKQKQFDVDFKDTGNLKKYAQSDVVHQFHQNPNLKFEAMPNDYFDKVDNVIHQSTYMDGGIEYKGSAYGLVYEDGKLYYVRRSDHFGEFTTRNKDLYEKYPQFRHLKTDDMIREIEKLEGYAEGTYTVARKNHKWDLVGNIKKDEQGFSVGRTLIKDFNIKNKKAAFTPAKTIQEAESFARKAGVKNVSFKNVDLEIANDMNKSMAQHFDDFPELKKNIKFWGSAQEKKKFLGDVVQKHYEKKYASYRETFGSKFVDNKIKKEVTSYFRTSGEWAHAFDHREYFKDDMFSGIAINKKYGSDLPLLKSGLKRSLESQFHPVGCDTVKSIFDHEFGHQLDYLLDISNNPDFIKIYTQGVNGKHVTTNNLSKYAINSNNLRTNKRETIAEAWAEYRNNPEPRDISKAIGELIEKEYERKFKL